MSGIEILVPEGVAADGGEIVVANWLAEDGDHVDAGDVVCELMVTKVTFEVEAPSSGRLEHHAQAEDVVTVGALLGTIATS